MPIFSTRSSKRGADEAPSRNVPIDSIETLRTRARQRLIGSAVLVVLGIITFSLLFGSQPRPIPVDIPIVMPDKDKPDSSAVIAAPSPAAPSTPPASASGEASKLAENASPAASAAATAAVQASASLGDKEEIVASKTEVKPAVKPEAKPAAKPEVKVDTKPETKLETKPDVKTVAKSEPKPEPKPESKPTAKPQVNAEAAKALAILEGKEPPKAAANPTVDVAERFVVQIGAFAENDKARAARLKVEGAGLKTYVHVAETPQGRRIRVRVGPFTTRAEAEKAASKIKTLDLPAAILTL